MTINPNADASHQDPRLQQAPKGLLAKMMAFGLGIVFLGSAFMFSLVALLVVAVGGLVLWGWLWWKTRALRKQRQSSDMNGTQIIEGEFVRQPDTHPERPLSH